MAGSGDRSAAGGVTAVLAEFCVARRDELPPLRRSSIARAFLDTVAVGVAGRTTDEVAHLRRWSDGQRAAGRATSWFDAVPVTPVNAALENAYAGHVLDYDDVSPATRLHPSVVLVPALLAAAESAGATGRELAGAYDVGAAVFRATADTLPAETHYRAGWHTTATAGLIAATGALCALYRMSAEQASHALGLCGSLASGSIRNFGSMAKALQVARAASDAVMAAELAATGFTANPRQLGLADGFFGMYGDYDAGRLAALPERLRHWSTAWPQDIAVKRYPSCYATHQMLDAAAELRAGGIDLADVVSVEVTAATGGLDPLIDGYPRSGLEAKFSAGYVLGSYLLDGALSLRSFHDRMVERAEIQDFFARVTVREAARPPVGPPAWQDGYTTVQAQLSDGRSVELRRDSTHGHADDPLSEDEFDDKLADCLTAGRSACPVSRLRDALLALPNAQELGAATAAIHEAAARRGSA